MVNWGKRGRELQVGDWKLVQRSASGGGFYIDVEFDEDVVTNIYSYHDLKKMAKDLLDAAALADGLLLEAL